MLYQEFKTFSCFTLECFILDKAFLRGPKLSLKDDVSHMCLTGIVVACWSLTQYVADLSPFTVITNIIVTEFSISGKLNYLTSRAPYVSKKT